VLGRGRQLVRQRVHDLAEPLADGLGVGQVEVRADPGGRFGVSTSWTEASKAAAVE
jgi:hypothetical protein